MLVEAGGKDEQFVCSVDGAFAPVISSIDPNYVP
jgi:hypothetical protein